MSTTPEYVDFDLDTAERPEKEQVKPFAANIAGRRVVMTDPANIDWQDLLTIENPTDFLTFCVSREDRYHILDQDIPAWKFAKLIEQYQRHYGLDPEDLKRRTGR